MHSILRVKNERLLYFAKLLSFKPSQRGGRNLYEQENIGVEAKYFAIYAKSGNRSLSLSKAIYKI